MTSPFYALIRLSVSLLFLSLLALPGVSQETEEKEGGIIGTGISKIGIVGTITELGSIYVNGLHILLPSDGLVKSPIGDFAASLLRPGHTVALTVSLDDRNRWRAQKIQQILPIVGPIETIHEDGRLRILGTEVVPPRNGPKVSPGDWVAISGLWQGDQVSASYVEILPHEGATAWVSGTFLPEEALRIGGSQIFGIAPKHLRAGQIMKVRGQPVPGGIKATWLEVGLFEVTPQIIRVEGYYSPPQPDGLYTVLGSGMISYTSSPQMIVQDLRVVHCGIQAQFGAAGDAATQRIIHALGCPR